MSITIPKTNPDQKIDTLPATSWQESYFMGGAEHAKQYLTPKSAFTYITHDLPAEIERSTPPQKLEESRRIVGDLVRRHFSELLQLLSTSSLQLSISKQATD